MFKPGDKVKAANKRLGHLWENHPEIMEVLHVSHIFGEDISIVGNPQNGQSDHDNTRNWVYGADMFELYESVDSVPSETIEHEGYIYTRGEKVQESWVKEGVWAINDDGDLAEVYYVHDEGVAWNTQESECNASYVEYFKGQYRPFEEKDWKWGMYCEYEGKIWLICIKPIMHTDGLWVNISNGGNIICVKASEITPTFKR